MGFLRPKKKVIRKPIPEPKVVPKELPELPDTQEVEQLPDEIEDTQGENLISPPIQKLQEVEDTPAPEVRLVPMSAVEWQRLIMERLEENNRMLRYIYSKVLEDN